MLVALIENNEQRPLVALIENNDRDVVDVVRIEGDDGYDRLQNALADTDLYIADTMLVDTLDGFIQGLEQ